MDAVEGGDESEEIDVERGGDDDEGGEDDGESGDNPEGFKGLLDLSGMEEGLLIDKPFFILNFTKV